MLIGILLYVLYGAYERFRNPPEAASGTMFIVDSLIISGSLFDLIFCLTDLLVLSGLLANTEIIRYHERGSSSSLISA